MLRSETTGQPDRTAAALKGLRLYQQADRTAAPVPMPVLARAGRASVRDYGGAGPAILFVPSLINPPDVLDIDGERSLLRWLATRGVRPLLIDWGSPDAAENDLTVAGHIETMLLPLIDAIGEPVALVGYCLGGTMAIAAAALRPVTALALIATPWRFGDYPDSTRDALADLWRTAEPATATLGVLPMEILQAAFWRLDPERTVTKYEAHGSRDPDDPQSQAFVRLEDWANDGPPLTRGAARELFLDLFAGDRPGKGTWRVAGTIIDPAKLAMPVLEIASTTDHIVPAATTPGVGERIDLALGHVGMIVGGRAKTNLWEPLSLWLSRATSGG
ncbi:MAG TPA: alpha/beta fold hydrolase [Sphingomonas sp.]|uniref:alpha/beta fold hydrolase n=1 Tax=Sphingomonas sp. TaxID=28214 RepID=UPI002BBB1D02|nr:alpha/beta fold hydrolase [Sphingomonas sp.]HMI18420.1 alpha/beta fold hydrolase [Sphingomonas sp.]